MKINWQNTKAAIMRNSKLKAVENIAFTHLDDLYGLNTQKNELLAPCVSFLTLLCQAQLSANFHS